DRLADAVVSVEYYLETLQHGREASPSMLDNADRALQALNVAEDAAPEEQAKEEGAPLEVDESSWEEAPATEAENPGEPAPEESGEPRPASSGEESAPPPAPFAGVPEWPPAREAGADPEIVAVFL